STSRPSRSAGRAAAFPVSAPLCGSKLRASANVDACPELTGFAEMTRIALISDIHSNLLALRAVLDEIARTGVDQVICLGDVANLGPEPNAVIEILAERGCPCIMGNHDEFLLKPELVLSYDEAPAIVRSVEWSRSRLSKSELDFIRGFERERKITLSGGTTLHVFHGS